jgi:hypothetical protein
VVQYATATRSGRGTKDLVFLFVPAATDASGGGVMRRVFPALVSLSASTFTSIDAAEPAERGVAVRVLYGTESVIDPTNGCGDCVRASREGMPAMSLRGNIVDYLDGRFGSKRGSTTHSPTGAKP